MLAEAALLAVLSVERGPGAEACLDQARLSRGVERRLKRRVFVSEAEAALRFRVTFRATGEQIEARIELSNRDGTPRGTRSLITTGHCSKLDDSLALSVALLADEPPDPEQPAPTAASSASSASSPPQPTPARARQPIELPPEVAAPREPWHASAFAAAKGGWGMLPEISSALVLALRAMPPDFPAIVLQGEAFWPARAERDAGSGARFRLLRAGLAICPQLTRGVRASAGICVGQQLGWLTAEGYGFDHDAKQQRLQYSFTLAGEGRLRLLPPVSIRGALGAELPVTRDRFASAGRNAEELFRPFPLGIFAEIGLESSLW